MSVEDSTTHSKMHTPYSQEGKSWNNLSQLQLSFSNSSCLGRTLGKEQKLKSSEAVIPTQKTASTENSTSPDSPKKSDPTKGKYLFS